MRAGVTRQEVLVLVNEWIGVRAGYLGDFTYRSHAEFYPEFCGLDLDSGAMGGTTRQRFMRVLLTAPPDQQARILRGALVRFPLGIGGPPTRTQALHDRLETVAMRLEGAGA